MSVLARSVATVAALGLFAALPAAAAPQRTQGAPTVTRPEVETVFAIDTTGSMGGLIESAKQRVWGIVNELLKASPRPTVRVGLIAYRDRGDAYVTKVTPLTTDLDRVYTTLMEYRADGGGDTPENVRRALHDGVESAGWSKRSPRVAQILFLVGDSPPHDDYGDEPDLLTTTARAVRAGLIVNTIQCGSQDATREAWQQIARRGEGQYFAIEQDGGVQAVTTRYDSRIAELGRALGGTVMAYGGGAGASGVALRARIARRAAATEMAVAAAPPAAQAERALNKVLNADAYADDMLQGIETGKMRLRDVAVADLPDPLQRMSARDRAKAVDKQLAQRKSLRAEITRLSRLRDADIAGQRKVQARASGKRPFDMAVLQALRRQVARKGIRLRG